MKQAAILLLIIAVSAYGVVLAGYFFYQRKLLFYPTHHAHGSALTPWIKDGETIGYVREGRDVKTIWLMLHGNAGQASDRTYALPCFPEDQSVFILEYPGFGFREGSPSKTSINEAAREGYLELRRRFPGSRICVAGESIGSGPSCYLGTLDHAPDKISLVVPFDNLADLAQGHVLYLPVRLLLRERWDNIESLRQYKGPVEIFGAKGDRIIPVERAVTLAQAIPNAVLHLIEGGHNEWSQGGKVSFKSPLP